MNDFVDNAGALPVHGKIGCSRCFNKGATWGKSVIEQEGWLLENNPMAWGSSDPELLVLGFSKGIRQTGKYLDTPFDEIAFSGFRARLEKALTSLGVLPDRAFASMFTAHEKDVAFGSLIRCSVAHQFDGKWSKSGDVINALANRTEGSDWALSCIDQHLSRLPARTKLVVLMSNDVDYVDATFNRLCTVRPRLERVNEVAYRDERVTFVHIVHCAGTSGSHYTNWMARNETVQGQKARLADEAVKLVGYQTIPHPTMLREHLMNVATQHKSTRSKAIPKQPRADSRDPHALNLILSQVLLEASARFARHSERPGTAYISMFVTPNGSAFAIDTTNLNAQPFWVARKDCSLELLSSMRAEIYPAERNRNSNLNVVGLKKGYDVVRFYPEDMPQARLILEHLVRR